MGKKGVKGICDNTGRTHFKKGFTPWNKGKNTGLVPKAAFKKGCIPWNKGIKIKLTEKAKLAYKRRKGIGIKGKKIINKYVFLYSPFHPRADKYGYVKRANLVMEKMIGRLLEPKEIVHHKGTKYPLGSIENKQDDRPENLQLFASEVEHHRHHWPNGFNPNRRIK